LNHPVYWKLLQVRDSTCIQAVLLSLGRLPFHTDKQCPFLSKLVNSDNTLLVELFVMFGHRQLSALRIIDLE